MMQSCSVIASSIVLHSWSLIALNLVPTVVSSWHSTAFSTHYTMHTPSQCLKWSSTISQRKTWSDIKISSNPQCCKVSWTRLAQSGSDLLPDSKWKTAGEEIGEGVQWLQVQGFASKHNEFTEKERTLQISQHSPANARLKLHSEVYCKLKHDSM